MAERHEAALLWLEQEDPPQWSAREGAPVRRAAVALLAAVVEPDVSDPRALLEGLAREEAGFGLAVRPLAAFLLRAVTPKPGEAFRAAATRAYRSLIQPDGFDAAWAAAGE